MRLIMCLVLGFFLVGCNKSEKGGGPEANDKTFTLVAPSGHTTIAQNESRVIQIEVNREKDFSEDIALKVINPPDSGVTAELVNPASVRHADAKVDLKVSVSPNAVLGTHHIRIIGTPTRGNATEVDADIKVEASPSNK